MRARRYLRYLFLVTILALAAGSILIAEDLQPPDRAETERIKSLKVEQRLYRVRDLAQSTALSFEDAWRLHGVRTIADSVQVRVLLKHNVTDSDLDALAESGGRIERFHQRSVQMILPMTALSWFEDQAGVAAVYVPNYGVPTDVISEGLDTLGVPPYHDLDYKGQGVKIAVLDGGFQDYGFYLGSELPWGVHTKSFAGSITDGGTHGTSCAQIVNDIAPEADMWLVRASTGLDFLDACDWLMSNNFDVVSISLGYFNVGWPDGASSLSSRIDEMRNSGILCVVAAGNEAEDHYIGYFTDSDQDSYHEFAAGDEDNTIYLNEGDELRVFLTWNDWTYSDNDYDMYLYNSDRTSLVGYSENPQTGSQNPTEFITTIAPYTGYYHIVIKNYSATGLHKFHLFIRGVTCPQ